jgi:surface antigen
MQDQGFGVKALILGSFIAICGQLPSQPANASSTLRHHVVSRVHHIVAHRVTTRSFHKVAHFKVAARVHHYVHGGISCVPFARADSGISVAGNAWQWWQNAAGIYARGNVPEPGSVLTFRANGRMRLGHVAVVSRVVNAREIEIDQANWWGPGTRGGVARNVPVVDVSDANDWTAVRVGLGHSGDFGAVYPTYGFIYDRPDNGVMVAATSAPAPQPELNPAPRDLRPAAERGWQTYEEVAEAPTAPRRYPPIVHHVVYHVNNQ